jgi:hypothetical protein
MPEVMMDVSFGERLRQQREQHQVPLATIADRTKIKIALLEGLERDDVSHWPAGIFRRSYIRAYAQAIGLDPDPVVREFLSHYPDPFEDDTAVEAVAKVVDGTTRRPPMRLTYLISSAIKALPRRSATVAKPETEAPRRSADDEWVPLSHDTGDDYGAAYHSAAREHTFAPLSPPERFSDDFIAGSAEPEFAGAQLLADASLRSEAHDVGAQPALFELSPPSPAEPEHHVRLRSGEDASSDAAIGVLAELCTRLARAEHATAIRMVVEDATSILGAIGLILWAWDEPGGALRPAVSHGYPEDMLAQVSALTPDADNAIASAFRSAETRLVDGNDIATGALAVPLLAPFGCVGVLAAEFRNGGERRERARAILTILAAQLSMLIGQPPALRAAASA